MKNKLPPSQVSRSCVNCGFGFVVNRASIEDRCPECILKNYRGSTCKVRKSTISIKESITMPIKKELKNTAKSTDLKTLKDLESKSVSVQKKDHADLNTKEHGMLETVQESLITSSEGESVKIPPLDCTQVLNSLEGERQSSIELLNNSSKQLMRLAKSVAHTRVDDDGEVLQTPQPHNIDTAIKCLAELRNTLKTKLDYLKLDNSK